MADVSVLAQQQPLSEADWMEILRDPVLVQNLARLASGSTLAGLAALNAEQIRVLRLVLIDWVRSKGGGGTIPGVPSWARYLSYTTGWGPMLLQLSSGKSIKQSYSDIFSEYNTQYETYASELAKWKAGKQESQDRLDALLANPPMVLRWTQDGMILEQVPAPEGTPAHQNWQYQMSLVRDELRNWDTKLRPKRPDKPAELQVTPQERTLYAALGFMIGFYPELIPETIKGLGEVLKGVGEIVPL